MAQLLKAPHALQVCSLEFDPSAAHYVLNMVQQLCWMGSPVMSGGRASYVQALQQTWQTVTTKTKLWRNLQVQQKEE